jgi:2-succinyl-6-hydroxy-2,4-cyclohexadiene-1-carboxylate synthase
MTFIALHGFTQRGRMWEELASLVGGVWVRPDLPGHGEAPLRLWEEAVAEVAGLVAAVEPPRHLIGYSMGGRLALAAALESPSVVDGLVLISGGPGFADGSQRLMRRQEDMVLADRIEALGVEAFLDEWLARPMFAGLAMRPAAWLERDLAARAASHAAGLAGALRLLGQGAQPYLGDRLGELKAPVLLIAGSEDGPYVARAEEMNRRIPGSVLEIVPRCGHAVVGERPDAVAAVLRAWIGSWSVSK